MSKAAEYLLQAEECQRCAKASLTSATRERWLELAANWLKLAQEVAGEAGRFTVYDGSAERDHPLGITSAAGNEWIDSLLRGHTAKLSGSIREPEK
jgi:hypothetical protein